MKPPPKPLHWISGSKADLRDCPRRVQTEFGYALHIAQIGGMDRAAKPLKGFSGAGVLEIVENSNGNTYRAVYTVKFALAVYVLHVFQKKSTKGIATPKAEIDLIRLRLKAAAEHYESHYRGLNHEK